jgi:hypothetical protein
LIVEEYATVAPILAEEGGTHMRVEVNQACRTIHIANKENAILKIIIAKSRTKQII